MEREFDTSSLFRLQHDTTNFRAIIEMLEQYPDEDGLPEKNYCINSEDHDVVYSDYFANAAFSRG